MGASESAQNRELILENPTKSSSTAASKAQPKLTETTDASTVSESQSLGPNKWNYDQLEKLDGKYKGWIESLDTQYDPIRKEMHDKYTQKARQVAEQLRYAQEHPPCIDAQNAVYQCYLANSSESLNCSNQVQSFSECVRNFQQEVRRRQQAEAAERRREANTQRGVGHQTELERKQKRLEEAERKAVLQGGGQSGGMKWRVD